MRLPPVRIPSNDLLRPGPAEGLRAGRLRLKVHLAQAQGLLYRCYCQQMKWRPVPGNASRQRIELVSGGALGLVDRYDRRATWIGLLHEDQVFGCIRAIPRRDNAPLEVENYLRLPGRVLALRGGLVEVNRLAIHEDFRHGPGLKLMSRQLQSLVDEQGWTVLSPVTSASKGVAIRYGQMLDTGIRYRYHPQDPEPTTLLIRLSPSLPGPQGESQVDALFGSMCAGQQP